MRKNFINKILMLFEVSHSFYFILHKPIWMWGGGQGGGGRKQKMRTDKDRAMVGRLGSDQKVNTLNNHRARFSEWWRWYRCPFIFRGVCVCVRVCLLYLGFSFSWPKLSAFRMAVPAECACVCVWVCWFFALRIFLLHFFFSSLFVFITLILTFLFLHSMPFVVHEYLWELVGCKRARDNHHTTQFIIG